jgi:hypothetical protein
MALAAENKKITPSERLLTCYDVFTLSEIAPNSLSLEEISFLGSLWADAIEAGYSSEPLISKLKKGTRHFGLTSYHKKKNTAKLLTHAGLVQALQDFLPDQEQAKKNNDYQVIFFYVNSWSQIGRMRNDPEMLLKAWKLNQWLVHQKNVPAPFIQQTKLETIRLYSYLPEQMRKSWLTQMYRSSSEYLNDTFSLLYKQCKQNSANDESKLVLQQLKTWKLFFNDSLECGFKHSDSSKQRLAGIGSSFALIWLDEFQKTNEWLKKIAENPYYSRTMNKREKKPAFLTLAQLLETAPNNNRALDFFSNELRSRILWTSIVINLKEKQLDEAFAQIKELAKSEPKQALNLCEQWLLTWSAKVNPQHISAAASKRAQKNITSIPLTRIRQIQNLNDLKSYYSKISALNIGDVRDEVLVKVFADCHSPSETYRKEDIIAIFGPIEKFSITRVSVLAKDIYEHISKSLTDKETQKEMDTGRSPEEIKKSLEDGFNLLITILTDHLNAQDDSGLRLALGNVYYGWAQHERSEEAKNNKLFALNDSAKKIKLAFEQYEKSILLYQQEAKKLPKSEYRVDTYTTYFNQLLDNYTAPNHSLKENFESWGVANLRKLILSTVEPEIHMDMFAQAVMKRFKSLKSNKMAYLEAALMVLQNHPSAVKARENLKYYQSLIQEVQLHIKLNDVYEHTQSKTFGVMVSLQHTDTIARESRGFYRFIAPAQKRAKEDYRLRFVHNIQKSLETSFEIKSITFTDASIRPRPLISHGVKKEGWSETPLAYILLESRSPAVDQIPSFPIDLTFYDINGEVTIPFPSNTIAIKKKAAFPTPKNLEVFEVLNDRSKNKDVITLEIRATANSIIPALDDVLNTHFDDFKVISIIDEGLQVNKLINEKQSSYPEMERNWTVSLKLADYQPNKPTKFHFPTPKDAKVPVKFSRYQDADLVEVNDTVDFNAQPMKSDYAWVWWLLVFPIAGLVALFVYMNKKQRAQYVSTEVTYKIPESLNPFTVVALLMTIRKDEVIKDSKILQKLNADIAMIEESQFSDQSSKKKIDLASLAKKWVKRASPKSISIRED